MKTRMANTSLEAFDSLKETGYLPPKEQEIVDVFKRMPGRAFSRTDLAWRAHMPINCVCGRVRSLLDKKVLRVGGVVTDLGTGKSQQLLSLSS